MGPARGHGSRSCSPLPFTPRPATGVVGLGWREGMASDTRHHGPQRSLLDVCQVTPGTEAAQHPAHSRDPARLLPPLADKARIVAESLDPATTASAVWLPGRERMLLR